MSVAGLSTEDGRAMVSQTIGRFGPPTNGATTGFAQWCSTANDPAENCLSSSATIHTPLVTTHEVIRDQTDYPYVETSGSIGLFDVKNWYAERRAFAAAAHPGGVSPGI